MNVPMYDSPSAPSPNEQVPKYEAPKAPPPNAKYDAPSGPAPAEAAKSLPVGVKYSNPPNPGPSESMRAPSAQSMHTDGDFMKVFPGKDVLPERQELLMKYRDCDDIRGKGTKDKLKAFLQYDYFEVNVDGNDSQQEQVFEGLLPGERVIMTLDAFIRHKQRTKFFICCCCFLTLGAYLVYLLCCSMCRKRVYASTKVTLGILSSGRLVYWHADKQGARRSLISSTDVDSQTYRRFYRMQDISMVQFKFKKLFDVFDENDADEQSFSSRPMGHLRIFTGKFPIVPASVEDWVTTPSRKLQVEELQRRANPTTDFAPPEDCFVKYGDAILRIYDALNLAYDTWIMIVGLFQFSIINMIRFIFLVFRNILNAYRLAIHGHVDPLDSVDVKDRCIDVYIHDDDMYSMEKTDGVYHKLVAFQKELLRMKNFKPALSGKQVAGHHFHVQKGEPIGLLKRVHPDTGEPMSTIGGTWALGTSSVGIHPDEIPLAEGEYIIDAYGENTHWAATDMLKTLITFGFYYLMYLRRTFTKKKAVILTNMRLIQIMKAGELRNRLPTYGHVVYDLDLKWWTLEGAYAGYVHDKGLTMVGEIATKQGVLRTTLTQMRKHFFTTHMLQDRVRQRFESFHFAAAKTAAGPIIKDPAAYGLEKYGEGRDARAGKLPPSMLPLAPKPNEFVLGQFVNENVMDQWVCGPLTSCLFCGFKPIILDGNILLSSHRYLAKLRPHFNPWCFGDCIVPSETFYLWADFDTKKTFQGWSLQGMVRDHHLMCNLCGLCCPSRERTARMSTVDFTLMAFNGRPVALRRKNFERGAGHMEDPDVKLLKHVMAAITAALELPLSGKGKGPDGDPEMV
eukprot:CAMPEP_0118927134 /NCGR_PEP_ID=MMETSP1169-20130426/4673_1 /TAXON_ID=36882 /ORGANISM="Pyramimonas obovata, Strain CCMP722" /LENGTH=847 /DNA_ID=CAMNT_0006868835 /DNA_START=137 /DNA_END=2680 /DNA_ORIENTATION=-